MLKILSIGNSFSEDAHAWLHKLAKINGFDMQTANLCIGGCSLERHWKNVTENNADYELEINGGGCARTISIAEALGMDDWDIVTLQQVSHSSGLPDTYEPYLSALADYIRKAKPKAKLYFHQTWAYEIDAGHSGFAYYDRDQRQMYGRIIRTAEDAARSIKADLIPVGRAVQAVRESVPEFDYGNGGISLCRDGFHLSLDYGRYIAAATWLRTLTGIKIRQAEFEDFDPALLEKILAVVNVL